jgi:hypothetical protein
MAVKSLDLLTVQVNYGYRLFAARNGEASPVPIESNVENPFMLFEQNFRWAGLAKTYQTSRPIVEADRQQCRVSWVKSYGPCFHAEVVVLDDAAIRQVAHNHATVLRRGSEATTVWGECDIEHEPCVFFERL